MSTKLSDEEIIMRDAIADYLRGKGIKVHSDNTVTLYHVTSKERAELIRKNGFKGSDAPVGGGGSISEPLRPRSFFGFDKNWVEKTWGSPGYETLEIRVPVQYIRQGAKNDDEVYIEGNIKKHGNVWYPDELPTSTFYDRRIIRRYKKKVLGESTRPVIMAMVADDVILPFRKSVGVFDN